MLKLHRLSCWNDAQQFQQIDPLKRAHTLRLRAQQLACTDKPHPAVHSSPSESAGHMHFTWYQDKRCIMLVAFDVQADTSCWGGDAPQPQGRLPSGPVPRAAMLTLPSWPVGLAFTVPSTACIMSRRHAQVSQTAHTRRQPAGPCRAECRLPLPDLPHPGSFSSAQLSAWSRVRIKQADYRPQSPLMDKVSTLHPSAVDSHSLSHSAASCAKATPTA